MITKITIAAVIAIIYKNSSLLKISLSVSFNLVTDLVTFSSLVTKLSDKDGFTTTSCRSPTDIPNEIPATRF